MINDQRSFVRRGYLVLLFCIGWFALIVQLILMIQSSVVSLPETLVRFFSYFTIQANILVTVGATALVVWPGSRFGKWFSGASPQTAVGVYIAVVALVYNLVLRQIWDLNGMNWVVNELLHVVVPVLYVIFWTVWTRKDGLTWRDIPAWLVYPAVYAIYILVRGPLSGWYPYPFMDVNQLGYGRVLLNSGLVVLVFLFFSLLPVAIAVVARRR